MNVTDGLVWAGALARLICSPLLLDKVSCFGLEIFLELVLFLSTFQAVWTAAPKGKSVTTFLIILKFTLTYNVCVTKKVAITVYILNLDYI